MEMSLGAGMARERYCWCFRPCRRCRNPATLLGGSSGSLSTEKRLRGVADGRDVDCPFVLFVLILRDLGGKNKSKGEKMSQGPPRSLHAKRSRYAGDADTHPSRKPEASRPKGFAWPSP